MRRLRHDRRILLSAALEALPAVAVALLILWLGDFAPRTRWTLTAVILLSWIAFASSLWERLVRPLQTVSNLLRDAGRRFLHSRARRPRRRSPGRGALRGQRADGDAAAPAPEGARGDRAALAGDGRDRRRRLRVRSGREAEA